MEDLAAGLKALVVMGMDSAAALLARTLPQLAHQNDAAKAALLDHFCRYLDLTALDEAQAAPDMPSMQASCTCCLHCRLHSIGLAYHCKVCRFSC